MMLRERGSGDSTIYYSCYTSLLPWVPEATKSWGQAFSLSLALPALHSLWNPGYIPPGPFQSQTTQQMLTNLYQRCCEFKYSPVNCNYWKYWPFKTHLESFWGACRTKNFERRGEGTIACKLKIWHKIIEKGGTSPKKIKLQIKNLKKLSQWEAPPPQATPPKSPLIIFPWYQRKYAGNKVRVGFPVVVPGPCPWARSSFQDRSKWISLIHTVIICSINDNSDQSDRQRK